MAAFGALLRFSRGLTISRQLGGQLYQRSIPIAGATLQKQWIQTTTPKSDRGPEELADRGNYTSHWRSEKLLTLALVPIIPGAIIFPNPVLDYLLTAGVVLHTHWGMTGVFSDYIHHDALCKMLKALTLMLSIVSFGALCYLNYSDIGFARAVRKLYSEL